MLWCFCSPEFQNYCVLHHFCFMISWLSLRALIFIIHCSLWSRSVLPSVVPSVLSIPLSLTPFGRPCSVLMGVGFTNPHPPIPPSLSPSSFGPLGPGTAQPWSGMVRELRCGTEDVCQGECCGSCGIRVVCGSCGAAAQPSIEHPQFRVACAGRSAVAVDF